MTSLLIRRFNLRMKQKLYKIVKETATKKETSINQFICAALEKEVKKDDSET